MQSVSQQILNYVNCEPSIHNSAFGYESLFAVCHKNTNKPNLRTQGKERAGEGKKRESWLA